MRRLVAGYSPDEHVPLGGYATLMGVWSAGVASFLARYADRLPKKVSWSDFALMSIATHKITRIATKDFVTSPIRAPFAKLEKSTGFGEVSEKSRGTGLRRAVGDLLTCNFCFAPWVAAALGAGFVLRPRMARFIASVFGAVAISDALQHVYSAEKRLAKT